ncbi:hypothetical protein AB6D11_00270 [Vibrio splendidus]
MTNITHSLSTHNLEYVLRNGEALNPSFAISKNTEFMKNYGAHFFVLKQGNINFNDFEIYNHDMYSPSKPETYHKINNEHADFTCERLTEICLELGLNKRLVDSFYDKHSSNGELRIGGLRSALYIRDNLLIKLDFMIKNGIKIPVPTYEDSPKYFEVLNHKHLVEIHNIFTTESDNYNDESVNLKVSKYVYDLLNAIRQDNSSDPISLMMTEHLLSNAFKCEMPPCLYFQFIMEIKQEAHTAQSWHSKSDVNINEYTEIVDNHFKVQSPFIMEEYDHHVYELMKSMLVLESTNQQKFIDGERQELESTPKDISLDMQNQNQLASEHTHSTFNKLVSLTATRINSLDDLTEHLKNIATEQEYEECAHSVSEELNEWAYSFSKPDLVIESLIEHNLKITPEFQSEYSHYSFSDDDQETVDKIISKVKSLPSIYLEAKAQSNIKLSQFEYVALSTNAPFLGVIKNLCIESNVRFVTFDPKLESVFQVIKRAKDDGYSNGMK